MNLVSLEEAVNKPVTGGAQMPRSTKTITFSLVPEMAERVPARGSAGNGSSGGGTNAVT